MEISDYDYNDWILRLVRYAIARASAASSGFGISGSFRSIWSDFCTCGFLAKPLPAIPCFTCNGVNSMIDMPTLASVWTITHRAWATSIPLVTFRRKKSRSIPHIVGRYVSISSRKSLLIWTSLSENIIPGFVSITQYSMIRRLFPSFSRRANQTVASHGSIPRIIIEKAYRIKQIIKFFTKEITAEGFMEIPLIRSISHVSPLHRYRWLFFRVAFSRKSLDPWGEKTSK